MKTQYRIIDNNGQWSNLHKSKLDALKELKRQREYDNAFYIYGIQKKIDGEWFTLEWFDNPIDNIFNRIEGL